MGLFSRKGAPSKAGSYRTAWPASSGLGLGPYSAESDRQEQYLVYTSDRRRFEPVPAEDVSTMAGAERLLTTMAGGGPVNEIPLIQGDVDVRLPGETEGDAFCANALVTDRRFILWWDKVRGRSGQMVITEHPLLIPRSDVAYRIPYRWTAAIVVPYPFQLPTNSRGINDFGVSIAVHFSSDGHANRRSESVFNTMLEVERRAVFGQQI